MFERILVPLDGSETAEMALPYAIELSRGLDSEVTLLHVCAPEHQPYEHMHRIYLDGLAKTVERDMKRGRSASKEVKVDIKVEAGEPSETICNLVDKNHIGLIIMTAVGTSGTKVATLGTVADRICQTVPIPVMLIKPQTAQQIHGKERPIKRILLPLDGSNLSKTALPVTEELAAKLKVPIALFQMAHMIYPRGLDEVAPIDYAKLSRDEEKRVLAETIALEKELREKGFTVTHSVTLGIDAGGEIIEAAKKADADLVVMTTHGRSGLARWVLGSVAEKVLRHGETPLLLVNARVS